MQLYTVNNLFLLLQEWQYISRWRKVWIVRWTEIKSHWNLLGVFNICLKLYQALQKVAEVCEPSEHTMCWQWPLGPVWSAINSNLRSLLSLFTTLYEGGRWIKTIMLLGDDYTAFMTIVNMVAWQCILLQNMLTKTLIVSNHLPPPHNNKNTLHSLSHRSDCHLTSSSKKKYMINIKVIRMKEITWKWSLKIKQSWLYHNKYNGHKSEEYVCWY